MKAQAKSSKKNLLVFTTAAVLAIFFIYALFGNDFSPGGERHYEVIHKMVNDQYYPSQPYEERNHHKKGKKKHQDKKKIKKLKKVITNVSFEDEIADSGEGSTLVDEGKPNKNKNFEAKEESAKKDEDKSNKEKEAVEETFEKDMEQEIQEEIEEEIEEEIKEEIEKEQENKEKLANEFADFEPPEDQSNFDEEEGVMEKQSQDEIEKKIRIEEMKEEALEEELKEEEVEIQTLKQKEKEFRKKQKAGNDILRKFAQDKDARAKKKMSKNNIFG